MSSEPRTFIPLVTHIIGLMLFAVNLTTLHAPLTSLLLLESFLIASSALVKIFVFSSVAIAIAFAALPPLTTCPAAISILAAA